MKKVAYILTVVFALALMSMGCEKENPNPDDENTDVVLRISKIADNSAMIDPLWEFEYNEKGLATEIGDDEGTGTIIYNDDNLPVKIGNIDVIWDENSFTLSYPESYDKPQVTYTIDANGRIIDQSYSLGDSDRGYEARWQGDKAEIYYVRDGSEEWAQTRELTEYNHPLSAINIAIITAGDFSWIYDECDMFFQNKYCLSYVASADEGSADYEYEYNEDGYPTQLDIFETTDGGIYKFYFEYESN